MVVVHFLVEHKFGCLLLLGYCSLGVREGSVLDVFTKAFTVAIAACEWDLRTVSIVLLLQSFIKTCSSH